MRLRLAIAAFVAMALAGCSLLISEDFAAEDTPPATEAGATDTTPNGDTGGSTPDVVTSDAGSDVDAALDPSLVAFWTFDENTSSPQRDETNRHDLVLSGATIDLAGGIRGGAIVFAGATSPRVEALSGTNYPTKGTLSFWFKYTYPDTDTVTRGLFDNWDSQRSHMFVRRVGGEPPGRFQTALQPQVTSSSYAWVQGFDTQRDNWTHVVMTWDSAAKLAALYVDGIIVKSSSFSFGESFEPAQQDFRFSDEFIGMVDEIRLYDRAMTAAEALLVP